VPCNSDGKNNYNTLSGFAVADEQLSWDTFELLHGNRSTDNVVHEVGELASFDIGDDVKLFVCVEDTGVGIPAQAQPRIFMPFMQADSSTSRTYGGTGIGLSISKCLAELMNGEMRFKSVQDVGSTFTCTLMLKKGILDQEENQRRPLSDPLPTRFKGMHALVVDGNRVRSEVTKYHLRRLGVQVRVLHDCRSTVQAVSRNDGASANAEARFVQRREILSFALEDLWNSVLQKQL
jgi:histidine kinase 2/3/4 (cytokinin receptor)